MPSATATEAAWRERLRTGAPLVLDGPLGTELTRRGIDTALPLWSARALISAPEAVTEIHREYVAAGADVITTNTFRTHRRSLAREGRGDDAERLTTLAVDLARAALPAGSGWVAGSVAPLEDCYRPDLTPPDASLDAEHAALCGWLAAAGVDLILVETMPTIREAEAATTAAAATGLPVVAGLACDANGRLLSGESTAEAGRRLEALGVDAIAVNCTPAPSLHVALEGVREGTGLPLGAYGNVGYAEDEQGWVRTDELDAAAYAALAARWIEIGARLVGSCCGTTPEHTRALATLVGERYAV